MIYVPLHEHTDCTEYITPMRVITRRPCHTVIDVTEYSRGALAYGVLSLEAVNPVSSVCRLFLFPHPFL